MVNPRGTAEEVLNDLWIHPERRLHLDWYDGPVQSLLTHGDHGTWYVFAVRFGAASERLYAALPVADPSILEDLTDLETRDDADWLVELGRDVLLPASAPDGWWMTVREGAVADVRPMTVDERATVAPRGLHDLMAG